MEQYIPVHGGLIKDLFPETRIPETSHDGSEVSGKKHHPG